MLKIWDLGIGPHINYSQHIVEYLKNITTQALPVSNFF
jgi:hypothetical protein